MKFVKVVKSTGRYEIALVNLSKVDVITYTDEGNPVLWIGDESWECYFSTLENSIVEI